LGYAAAIIFALLAVLATAFGVYARIQGDHAVAQSRRAQSVALASEGANMLGVNAPLGMLLSLQADEGDPTIQAESALFEAAQQPLDKLLVTGSPVYGAAFSPDGRVLATGDEGGHVILWNPVTGQKSATFTLGANSSIYALAYSPNGQAVAASDFQGQVGLWDSATGREVLALFEELNHTAAADKEF
jgi:hypothetical protein